MKNSSLKRYFTESLRRNSLFLMASQVASALFGFFFWLIAARLYSAEEVGLATAIISAMMFIAALSLLGYDIGLVRFLSTEGNKREMINTCLTVGGLLSVIIASIFIATIKVWSTELIFMQGKWYYAVGFILFTVSVTLGMLLSVVFIAFRHAEFQFIQSLISGLKLLLVVGLVGWGAFGIYSSWSLFVFLSLATGILFTIRLYPSYRPVPIIRKNMVRAMAHFSLSNYAARGLEILPTMIMPLLILGLLSAEASAYFFIPFSICGILGMIPGSTGLSLLAEGSYQPAMLQSQVVRAGKFTLVFLIPGILILFFLGDKILSFFGTQYVQNSLWMLRLLALSWLPGAINLIYISIVRVQMKIKPLIYVYAFTAAFTIGASYFLMEQVGLVGVGIAWLLARGIVALVVVPVMLKMPGISVKGIIKIASGF